ncbi:hypothetical protein NC651_022125 [Populus alba x Populus x berolinensis]|nr:hypothetical protein NC651_022125 [Populus alba x Populus x berolinensis]
MMTVMNGCKSSQCLLEELPISWCPFLKSTPRGMLPINLKSLAISRCENLIESKLENQVPFFILFKINLLYAPTPDFIFYKLLALCSL